MNFLLESCRICLSRENRLISIANSPLQEFYEKFTEGPLHTGDGRPTTLCYICCQQLRRSRTFLIKSQKANTLFTDLLNQKLSEHSVDTISKELNWTMSVSTSSSTVSKFTEIDVDKPELNYEDITCEVDFIKVEVDEYDSDQPNFPDASQPYSPGEFKHEVLVEEIQGVPVQPQEMAENGETQKVNDSQNTLQRLRSKVRQNVQPQPLFEFACKQCDEEFPTKFMLEQHYNAYHKSGRPMFLTKKPRPVGNKRYQCTVCETRVSSRSNLSRHLRSHLEEKPYKCELCVKSFTDRGNLIKHIRTHTGERPYKCEYCEKAFSQGSVLTKHIRTHTGEKPYKCGYCDKCFSLQMNLNTHIRIHTGERPYKCEYCEKCFAVHSVLTRHIRTHTNEKPYKCKVCEKCFADPSAVTKHMRVHTGEKPYKCQYCDKCFSQLSNLTKHYSIHKNE